MPLPAKKPAKKHGPGEYKPDIEYKRIEDLPKAKVLKENRNEPQRACAWCGQSARREHVYPRQWHDVGDLVSGRPIELHMSYSQHHCQKCNKYFMTDVSDIAPPASHYTHRLIALAVRVVVSHNPFHSISPQQVK